MNEETKEALDIEDLKMVSGGWSERPSVGWCENCREYVNMNNPVDVASHDGHKLRRLS